MGSSYTSTTASLNNAGPASLFSCPGCENGDCTADDVCTCYGGYFGSNCTEYNCSMGCLWGTCDGPYQCTCYENATGLSCNLAKTSDCFELIYGCMDPSNIYYNPNATADNGSCYGNKSTGNFY